MVIEIKKLFYFNLHSFAARFPILFLVILFCLTGCLGKSKVDFKMTPRTLNITVSNIQVIDHQVIITGTNLDTVHAFQVKADDSASSFDIESATKTSLVANAVSSVSFAAGKVLDFVFSSANASATFTVNFSLCDSDLNGKGFNCSITPNDKDVLAYDAVSGKWKPRAVNGLSYQGSWDASGALPVTSTAGDYFIVSVASGAYLVGDWIVYNGTTFDHVQNSSAIINVFGRTGAITANKGDYTFTKLADVDLTTVAPVNGNFLKYDGTNWVPGTIAAESDPTVIAAAKTALPACGVGQVLKSDGASFSCVTDTAGSGTFSATPNRVVATDGAGALSVTAITDTVLSYLSGVSSNIQTQLDAKLNTASFVDWSVAGLQPLEPTRLNLTTASRAVVTNAQGVPMASAVTTTELGHLSGTTSAIQTQIDNLTDSAWTLNGSDIHFSTGNVGIGTDSPAAALEVQGQVRTTTSGGAAKVNTTATVDWNNGNAQSMSVACTTTTFTNMLDGGTYLLAISETGTSTCIFSQAGLTFYYYPANGNRSSGQRTVYSFQRIGTDVYVSWIAGFQ